MSQGICSFGSPQLATAVGGAAPTFAFATTNSNYFALQGQFGPTSNAGQTCTFPPVAQITPLIIDASSTRTCRILSGSSIYSEIDCPTVVNNQFAPATYTLSFDGLGTSLRPQNFAVIRPTSVVVQGDTATQTVLVTATSTVFVSGASASGSLSTPTIIFSSAALSSSSVASVSSPAGSPSVLLSSSSSLSSSILQSISSLPSSIVSSSSVASSSSASSSSGQTSVSASSSSAGTSSQSSSSSSTPTSSLSTSKASSSPSSSKASSSPNSTKASTSPSSTKASTSTSSSKISSTSSSSKVSSTPSPSKVSSSASSSKTSSSLSSSGTGRTTLSTASTRISSSASAVPTLRISPDGSCGGNTGYTCKGSTFSACCSQYGWCGSTKSYCGTGCQLSFGTCSASSSSSSVRPSSSSARPSASPVSSLKVSTDGTCGGKVTCKGSKYGNCCSRYGWCGSTSGYCGTGCHSGFGDCTSSKRFAARDVVNNLGARQDAVTGGGPDYTYPPIPTSTVYVATATVYVTVATVTVTVAGNAPATSSMSLTPDAQASSSIAIRSSAADAPSSLSSASISADLASIPLSLPTPNVTPVSSSTGPVATVAAPANFCLKVITPGVVSTDWRVKHTSVAAGNGNYQLDPAVGGTVGYVARYMLDDTNRLILTTPGLDSFKETGHSRGTGGMLRFRALGGANPTTCHVYTDVEGFIGQMVLKCVGGFLTAPPHTYTAFRHYNKISPGVTNLFATDDLTTNEDGNFLIDLGLYTGDDCPVDAPVTSSDVSTPTASADLTSPTPDLSSSSDTPSPSIDISATPSSSIPASSATPDASSSIAASTSADSSSSVASLTLSATSDLPSATPTTSPNSVGNFCLKVLTPNVKSTGWVITQTDATANNGALFLYPSDNNPNPVTRFTIDSASMLTVTTPGGSGTAVTDYSRGTGSMFRFRAPYSVPGNVCVIKTYVAGYEGQQVLKCTGGFTTAPMHTYTGFRNDHWTSNGLDYLDGTDDFTTPDTADNFIIELGPFTGGVCPSG
ncbi:hypothetical protein EK21DRAFT_85629 [Setomelanomma holmii]|uniref:Chitin-binding type-1 domain-containing protein n=1 Tax=Setomelanomma holmii TaxID=210430 RepID=A0A9P4LSW9_9PLEO|nr:hypothetical protein EK21DRAFT_85629 [Setomelanomma holmii]